MDTKKNNPINGFMFIKGGSLEFVIYLLNSQLKVIAGLLAIEKIVRTASTAVYPANRTGSHKQSKRKHHMSINMFILGY